MSLFSKIKDLFTDDPTFESQPQKEVETQKKVESPNDTPAQTEAEEKQVTQESANEKEAPTKPQTSARPTAPAAKKNAKKKENYIVNKYDAINTVCANLGRYAGSKDPDLAVLKLWVIKSEDADKVNWGDSGFEEELKLALKQNQIEAIKRVELQSPTYAQFLEIKKEKPEIQAMVPTRLYYLTAPLYEKPSTDATTPHAWLICVAGSEYMTHEVITLNPEKKKIWNIGRCEKPDIISFNDIVIKDNCTDISRQQAALVVDSGKYYLKCKQGGCRMEGGKVTKVLRNDGRVQELQVKDYHRALQPLDEGDVIQLSKSVYLRFTLTDPSQI